MFAFVFSYVILPTGWQLCSISTFGDPYRDINCIIMLPLLVHFLDKMMKPNIVDDVSSKRDFLVTFKCRSISYCLLIFITDMIAIPDFAAGAMENWGLITYRETALLYDEKVSAASNKQRVAVVVSHELAHQVWCSLQTLIIVTYSQPIKAVLCLALLEGLSALHRSLLTVV